MSSSVRVRFSNSYLKCLEARWSVGKRSTSGIGAAAGRSHRRPRPAEWWSARSRAHLPTGETGACGVKNAFTCDTSRYILHRFRKPMAFLYNSIMNFNMD